MQFDILDCLQRGYFVTVHLMLVYQYLYNIQNKHKSICCEVTVDTRAKDWHLNQFHLLGGDKRMCKLHSCPTFFQGKTCCSEYSISFHHMDVKDLYMFDYLLYNASVYSGKSSETFFNPQYVKPHDEPYKP